MERTRAATGSMACTTRSGRFAELGLNLTDDGLDALADLAAQRAGLDAGAVDGAAYLGLGLRARGLGVRARRFRVGTCLRAGGLGMRVERGARIAGAAGDAPAELGDAIPGGAGADLGLLEAHHAEADGDVAGVGKCLLCVVRHARS